MIFEEACSGAKADRPELKCLLEAIKMVILLLLLNERESLDQQNKALILLTILVHKM